MSERLCDPTVLRGQPLSDIATTARVSRLRPLLRTHVLWEKYMRVNGETLAWRVFVYIGGWVVIKPTLTRVFLGIWRFLGLF